MEIHLFIRHKNQPYTKWVGNREQLAPYMPLEDCGEYEGQKISKSLLTWQEDFATLCKQGFQINDFDYFKQAYFK